MSDQNVEVVRRLMRRFVEQDVQAALEDITTDATLDWSDSDAPDRGVYTGHAGWSAFIEARDEALGARGIEFIDLLTPRPDTVVLVGRVRERGRASGVEVAARGAAVFMLRDGKVSSLKLFQTSEEAFKAVELTER
jgi:ketosteroid isomerase-like protein